MSLPLFDFSGLASSLCSIVSSQESLEQRGFDRNGEMEAPPSKVGIGALLSSIAGLKYSPWYVSVVLEGSTAHVAGLEPGDVVIQVKNIVRDSKM
jgi:hypothetical protein